MPLSTGTRLGPYEILALLGAGGMGEVYRATDTKLSRAFALKVLSPTLAGDADYMARFTREAQVDGLFWIRADGSGKPQRLTQTNSGAFPWSFTPDAKWLAWGNSISPVEGVPEQWWLAKSSHIPNTKTEVLQTAFSPDGRWLAYASTESGRKEVYVRPSPGMGGRWQISNAGGFMPVWSRAGHEQFFRTLGDSRIMVAAYETQGDSPSWPASRASGPKPRFQTLSTISNFDIAPDGKRFAVIMASEKLGKPQNELTVLLNFFTELRRRAGAGEGRP